MGIEGEDWEIEDRGLTGISPIRGAPWVSCESPLTAGVLAGVVEEAVEVAVASVMEIAAASVVEVAGASMVEVAGASVVFWVLFAMRP